MDLNTLVQTYRISRSGGRNELAQLRRYLKDVPVVVDGMRDALVEHQCFPEDLVIHAEFIDPQARLLLLDDCMGYDEADEATAMMQLPYPLLRISGETVSRKFYGVARRRFNEWFEATGASVRLLAQPGKVLAGVVYPKAGGQPRSLGYVEFMLEKELL